MGHTHHPRTGPANHPGRVRSYRYVGSRFSDMRSTVAAQPSTSRTADNPSPTPSAAQRVFAIPELLEMILTRLPPGPLHRAMQVSKRFYSTIDPKPPSSVSSMRVALGLLFGRKIEDMTPWEQAELAVREEIAATVSNFLYDMPDQTLHRRFHWLLNVTLDPKIVSVVRDIRLVSVPTLSIDNFRLTRIARGDHAGRKRNSRHSGDESSNVLTLRFSFVAKGYEQDVPTTRGIIRGKDRLYPIDGGRASWFGVKILTMPFDVRVCVSVDFRGAMLADGHHIGHCHVPGCQVGVHGVQETSILFPPDQANLGSLDSFLNGVEHHAIRNTKIIRRQTTHQMSPSSFGEPYYLGFPSQPPPRLEREWSTWW